jgi:hypothetical protein
MTPHRLPLDPDRARWPFPAWEFYMERVAILQADGIPDAARKSEEMARRWWAGVEPLRDW